MDLHWKPSKFGKPCFIDETSTKGLTLLDDTWWQGELIFAPDNNHIKQLILKDYLMPDIWESSRPEAAAGNLPAADPLEYYNSLRCHHKHGTPLPQTI